MLCWPLTNLLFLIRFQSFGFWGNRSPFALMGVRHTLCLLLNSSIYSNWFLTLHNFEFQISHNVLIVGKLALCNVHQVSLLIEVVAVCTCLLEFLLFHQKFNVIWDNCGVVHYLHFYKYEQWTRTAYPGCGLPPFFLWLRLFLQSSCFLTLTGSPSANGCDSTIASLR